MIRTVIIIILVLFGIFIHPFSPGTLDFIYRFLIFAIITYLVYSTSRSQIDEKSNYKENEEFTYEPEAKLEFEYRDKWHIGDLIKTDEKTGTYIKDQFEILASILYPDNLVFHPNGDLYILQDIPKYLQYLKMRTNGVWVAQPDKNNDKHADNIKLFASWAPVGSEPSGAIFSHDGQFMYINRLENDDDTTGMIIKITGFNK